MSNGPAVTASADIRNPPKSKTKGPKKEKRHKKGKEAISQKGRTSAAFASRRLIMLPGAQIRSQMEL